MENEFKILIIDDDEVDILAIKRSLKKAGLKVNAKAALNMTDAQVLLVEEVYDCIFLDYRLPEGNGVVLLRELRDRGYRAPIVVVTGQSDPAVAVEVMKAGGTDFVTKGLLTPEGISQVLRNAARTHALEEERYNTARALEESQARLAEAQRIAHLGSWETDLESGLMTASSQFFRILGYTEDHYEPGNYFDYFRKHAHPQDLGEAMQAFSRCVIEREEIELDMRIITESDEVKPVEVHCRPILDTKGDTIRILGTLQDISGRKSVEKTLIEARDLAERSASAKEEFLANMSHEIRTPMNAILGFANLLYETSLTEEQREYLTAIDTAGEALIAIINDILDLSKIESGRLTFSRIPFDLSMLLEALKRIFAGRAKERGLDLSTFTGPGVPHYLVGDEVRLNQLLMNLVGNALKFTSEGEIAVEVKCLEEEDDAVRLLFEVHDTGIGIPRDKQRAIFESFTQASNETTRKYGGTGLGLTICKRIVELQQGRIGVNSEEGEGSTFFFELDFAIATEDQLKANQKVRQLMPKVELPPLHILLVEDNPMNQRLTIRLLEKMGHTLAIANNGREALEIIETDTFNLILMDIQMPEMDGYEATRRIRNHSDPALRNLPIIAMTAHVFAEELEKCRAAGMNDFLPKPFKPDDLQHKLGMVITGKRMEIQGRPSMPLPIPSARLSKLDELVEGNSDFKRELMEIFVEEVPVAVSRMENALEDEDFESLYQAAHRIKPSYLLFEVGKSESDFPELERLIKNKSTMEALTPYVHRIGVSGMKAVGVVQQQLAKD